MPLNASEHQKVASNRMGLPIGYDRVGDNLTLTINCIDCDKQYKLHVTSQEWYNWTVGGLMIQAAFPALNAGERELLVSGLCDDCFPKA